MENIVSRRGAKGPRLWLLPERKRSDGTLEKAVWYIRDDARYRVSTGFRVHEREQAENALAIYIGSKRLAKPERNGAADQVLIADVISLYAIDVASKNTRPREVAGRLERLLAWWGKKRLSEVTGRSCRAYAAHRVSASAARRELEDLRAAIRYHRTEGLCREVIEVVLPDKSEPRIYWLTRDEVAKLVWTAWRKREVQDGSPTKRRPWQHVARFILLAVYTGTRSATVCASSFHQEDNFGWIDLKRGIWYRRPEGQAVTKKRRPPVPLPANLLAHLRRWASLRDYPITFHGQPVQSVDKAFRYAAHEAGLPQATPHVLRHTAATWLMQAGVDMWQTAGYLGMTVETLERVYGHHHPDHLSGAVAAMRGTHRQIPRHHPDNISQKAPENSSKILLE